MFRFGYHKRWSKEISIASGAVDAGESRSRGCLATIIVGAPSRGAFSPVSSRARWGAESLVLSRELFSICGIRRYDLNREQRYHAIPIVSHEPGALCWPVEVSSPQEPPDISRICTMTVVFNRRRAAISSEAGSED